MNIITSISSMANGFFFLQNLPDVFLAAKTEADVVVSVNLQEVLSEKLYCEEDGNVYLRDLPGLLSPYMSAGVNAVYVSFNDQISAFRVLLTEAYIVGPDANNAIAWIGKHFLSSAREKRLAEDSVERIAACGDNLGSMSYRCLFRNAMGYDRVVVSTFNSNPVLSVGSGHTVFDVSPSRFASLGGGDMLLGYCITLGDRRISYQIDRTMAGRALHFSFVNAFGIEEYVTIPGVVLSSRTVDRTETVHLGYRKNIDPQLNMTHKIRTGVLTAQEMTLLSEMAVSSDIKFRSRGHTWVSVVLSDNPKIEQTTDETRYNYAEFSIRYVNHDRRIGDDEIHGDRIFDESFDTTFE